MNESILSKVGTSQPSPINALVSCGISTINPNYPLH